MIVYEGLKTDFVNDVDLNLITDKISAKYKEHFGKSGDSQIKSWTQSMFRMRGVLADEAIPDNCGVAIEYNIPTTSKRMDPYTPRLLDLGVAATIGKGERSKEVCEAIKRNQSVYLCAIGGAGALAALSISKCEVIAFDDLGCESVKKLEFNNFPLIVGIDCKGGNIFDR